MYMKVRFTTLAHSSGKFVSRSLAAKLLFVAVLCGMASSAKALDQVDGVYQIGNAQDLKDFANGINDGTISNTSNAILTADIDMSYQTYTPIGNDSHKYGGTFDGQGHVIDYLVLNNGSYNDQGIFGVVQGGATIKNLIAGPNNSITGNGNVGGLIGITNGNDSEWITIENCGNEGNVEATGTGGAAIIGICYNGSRKIKILNCYNTGNIKANSEAAILTGWFGGSSSEAEVKNFYNTGDVTGQDDRKYFFRGSSNTFTFENVYDNHSTTYVQTDQTVKACASAWYRWPYDLNFSGDTKTTVWKFVSSVNHPRPIAEAPISKDGDCYLIADDHDLYWLAMVVNNNNTNIKAKQTSDIDFSDYASEAGNGDDSIVKNVMIGAPGHPYRGTYNGQGHTVTVNYSMSVAATGENSENNSELALFRRINNATIQNLVVDGTINSVNKLAAGIVSGIWQGGTIENCICKVTLNDTKEGYEDNDVRDITFGGIVARLNDRNNNDQVIIKNTAFIGTINAPHGKGSGGIIGWAGERQEEIKNVNIENCFVSGTLNLKTNDNNDVICRVGNNDYVKTDVTNCYYTKEYTDLKNGKSSAAIQLPSHTESNGNLCFSLNNNTNVWHQTIGTDAYPVPFGTDHLPVSESDGDYYNTLINIATANELNTFATNYNNGNYSTGLYKVRLTADIDFNGITAFPGIGQNKVNSGDPDPNYKFAGTFDGGFHIIKNLAMTYNDNEGVGLINSATGGAVIKNLTIDSSCSFSGKKAVGAFVGGVYNNSGTVTFLNCGNEGSVTSTGQNAGGILGCNFNGNIAIHMTNCYNTGAIKSGSEGGALSGWVSENKQIYNCYNSGTLTNCAGLLRGNATGNITNCWSTSDVTLQNDDNSRIADNTCTSEQISDGTVFVALHDYTNADPAVDGSVWRMEFSGTPHPVLYDADIVLKENFPNRPVAQSGNKKVKLYRTTVADTWNTFSVPFSLSSEQVDSVFGDGAKVAELTSDANNTLHFTSVDAIAAGKAYLVKPSVANTASEYKEVWVNISKNNPDTPETAYGGYKFIGIFAPYTLTGSEYVMTTNKTTGGNTIKRVSAGTEMKGFRAYLAPFGSGARATSFTIDEDGTTGIITATGDVIENGKMYNLGGQRVSEPQRGLYIVNGKKVIR